MTPRRLILSAAGVLAVAMALTACAKPRTAPPAAPLATAVAGPAVTPAAIAVRDSQYADDFRQTLVTYYQRVEWSYAGGRCAITDPRSARTTYFECGRIRIGTQPDSDVTDLIRTAGGRTVDLHPGDAPWRRIVVRPESERAAILQLLADPRVRWAGLDFQAQPQPRARPRRRVRSAQPTQPAAPPTPPLLLTIRGSMGRAAAD